MKVKVTDILNFIASNLGFTPTGGVAATNVQSAIAEVDSEKVSGPASATDNAITRFDGTTGKLVQNSGVTIDDSGNMQIAGTFNAGGVVGVFDNATGCYTTWARAGAAKGDAGTGNHLTGGSNDDFGLNARVGALVLATNQTNRMRITNAGGIILDIGLSNYADDTAAAAGGIAVGQLYRNGSVVMIRVT